MTRLEFVNMFHNELRGYAVAAFAKEWSSGRDPKAMAEKGEWMTWQMKAATELLERMYDAVTKVEPPPKVPSDNGKAPVKR